MRKSSIPSRPRTFGTSTTPRPTAARGSPSPRRVPRRCFGDTAVAVNPNDERYTNLIGKQLVLPLTGRTIPVIADEYVEMEFGSGAVKITPAHDPNDFEVGLRHNLDMPRIMNDDATMSDLCPEQYRGLTREECRKKAVADLEAQGYLVKIEDYAHNVGECYRCHTTVEPIISKQWFVDMKPLAKPALEAVYDGRTKFVPERFSRTYYNWMENIRDWCISRQLWWGHRIPAWYCATAARSSSRARRPQSAPSAAARS